MLDPVAGHPIENVLLPPYLDRGHAMWIVLFIATMVSLSALGLLAACEDL
jgi:hypothetical protein